MQEQGRWQEHAGCRDSQDATLSVEPAAATRTWRQVEHIARLKLCLACYRASPAREAPKIDLVELHATLSVLRVVVRVGVAPIVLVGAEHEDALDATHLHEQIIVSVVVERRDAAAAANEEL